MSPLAYAISGLANNERSQESGAERWRKRSIQQLGQGILQQGISTAPVQSPWGGLARLGQAALGAYMQKPNMFSGGAVSPVGGGFDINAARVMPGGFMPGFGGS